MHHAQFVSTFIGQILELDWIDIHGILSGLQRPFAEIPDGTGI